MKSNIFLVALGIFLLIAGYIAGNRRNEIVEAASSEGVVPKSYGRLVTAIPDQIGTGLVFEDKDGVIRFVSVTGMKEGQLARYEETPTQGGVPRSYGHLVAAVVNAKGTALVFEDANGVIRFVTIKGETEAELKRE
jgi:hypothetical protein